MGNGSRLRFAATVQVKIPLVGGKLENSIGAELAENIPMIQRFTIGVDHRTCLTRRLGRRSSRWLC